MTQSIHDKLQKIEANIAALEIKQQYLKERISHHIMRILDQENAFAMNPPLLFGAIIDALQKIKTGEATTPTNDALPLNKVSEDKKRLTEIGEGFLKKRVPKSNKTKASTTTPDVSAS